MMDFDAMPQVKEVPAEGLWWQPLSHAFSGGMGSVGRSLDRVSEQIKLNRHELYHALQVQLYYARRSVNRRGHVLGRMFNQLSSATVGYVRLPAVHARQVIDLAGEVAKDIPEPKRECLLRMDVAEAALKNLREEDET
ncbi:MAG: hypothetical protein AAF393_00205 [Pseudomonadota bacterium]